MVEKPRVLLKISGQTLADENGWGYSRPAMDFMVEECVSVHPICELAILPGGGNLIRGTPLHKKHGIDKIRAHYMGMGATVLNAYGFEDVLNQAGLETRLIIAAPVHTPIYGEVFLPKKAESHLEKGRIVIFAGGLGEPNFTTDTAMINRALAIKASLVLKGTKVDGVYDKDPAEHEDAKKIGHTISYADFLSRDLGVIDTTAVTLARQHGIKIRIFNIFEKGNLKRAIIGEPIGTEIC